MTQSVSQSVHLSLPALFTLSGSHLPPATLNCGKTVLTVCFRERGRKEERKRGKVCAETRKLETSPGTIFMYYNPSLMFNRLPDSCLGKGMQGQGDVGRGGDGRGEEGWDCGFIDSSHNVVLVVSC